MFKMFIEDKYYAFTLVTSGRGDVQEHSRGEEAGKYVFANGPPWCDRSLDSGIARARSCSTAARPHGHVKRRGLRAPAPIEFFLPVP